VKKAQRERAAQELKRTELIQQQQENREKQRVAELERKRKKEKEQGAGAGGVVEKNNAKIDEEIALDDATLEVAEGGVDSDAAKKQIEDLRLEALTPPSPWKVVCWVLVGVLVAGLIAAIVVLSILIGGG